MVLYVFFSPRAKKKNEHQEARKQGRKDDNYYHCPLLIHVIELILLNKDQNVDLSDVLLILNRPSLVNPFKHLISLINVRSSHHKMMAIKHKHCDEL